MSEVKLKDLKVGDKVIVSSHLGGEFVSVVEKITPKGFLKVGGSLFYQNGIERTTGWHSSHIRVATENDIKKLEQRYFIKFVLEKMHHWKDLDYEQAKEINELLEK